MLTSFRKQRIREGVADFSRLSKVPMEQLELEFTPSGLTGNRTSLYFLGSTIQDKVTLISDEEYHAFRSKLNLMTLAVAVSKISELTHA